MNARKIAMALGLAALTGAHGVMDTPKPYGFKNGLTTGPITRSGFPCKKNEVSFADNSSSSTWSGGSAQPLHLTTAATHGGGTCFIAMTYATPSSPAFEDAANWRNIYTIPGDCPATTAGGLDTVNGSDGYPSGRQCSSPDSNEPDCVHSYNIGMPDELVNGPATFGWIWLSRVTDETYMNCAPITIVGAKNNGGFDSLPSLEGLSFAGLSGGPPPMVSKHSSGNSFRSKTTAAPTTRPKAHMNSTAIPEVSNAVVVNPSGSSVCREGSVPCKSSGFFCINQTTFGECTFGCAVPMHMVQGTTCRDGVVVSAKPKNISRRRIDNVDRDASSCNTS